MKPGLQRPSGRITMKPWLVVASVVAIARTPSVARLVIITEPAGNSRAELLARPCSVMDNSDGAAYRQPVLVRSVGVYQATSPPSQYEGSDFEGVPPPMKFNSSPHVETTHPSGIRPSLSFR